MLGILLAIWMGLNSQPSEPCREGAEAYQRKDYVSAENLLKEAIDRYIVPIAAPAKPGNTRSLGNQFINPSTSYICVRVASTPPNEATATNNNKPIAVIMTTDCAASVHIEAPVWVGRKGQAAT